jgi:hypothetical protein
MAGPISRLSDGHLRVWIDVRDVPPDFVAFLRKLLQERKMGPVVRDCLFQRWNDIKDERRRYREYERALAAKERADDAERSRDFGLLVQGAGGGPPVAPSDMELDEEPERSSQLPQACTVGPSDGDADMYQGGEL